MAIDRRSVLAGLSASALTGLAGCSGTQPGGFSFANSGFQTGNASEKQPDIVLNADGTPKLEDLMKAGPLGEKSLGQPNAPVTMIKYASLTCPYCRAFHTKTFPELKRRYIDTGKIRYILREFPIGHASGAATVVMRCIGQNDDRKYFEIYDLYLTKQHLWVSLEVRKDAIYKIVAPLGITRKTFDTCFENQNIVAGLKWVKQRGRQLGVIGTPTFFINGKKARSVLTIGEIQKMVQPYLS
ncbi:disulfide bond formation protein D [bacterium MnTg02]|nr:disulfide bond formation protein D [bacterium MnTg02]